MLKLKKCKKNDCALIYKWINDPIARKNSFHTELIPYEVHCNWYNNSLNNKNRLMYIAMEEEIPVAQIRIDNEDGIGVISYVVDEKQRGNGYGYKILNLIKEQIKDMNIEIITGLVKKDNIPSRKAFLKCNFVEVELDGFIKYSFTL